MKVLDALSIEGTSCYEVLCYGVFSPSELDAAYQALLSAGTEQGSKVHKLIAQGWPYGVILNEVRLAADADISAAIFAMLSRMFDAGPCIAALCMYDGAFGSYEDILASAVAEQTYAVCLAKGAQVINLDPTLLSSKEWMSMVVLCRQQLVAATALIERSEGTSPQQRA